MTDRLSDGRLNLAWNVDFAPVALLSIAWLACAVLINPVGDFPLNDDWAFGLPVEVLLTDHTLKLTDWQSPLLFAQFAWGALFCLPMGFSFTALRLSTLTLGLVGIGGLYALLRHLGADRGIAAFGTAVMVFNPYYFLLSNGFMSDIPFFTFMVLAMLLLMRGADLNHNGEIVVGLTLALVSMFIRQLGLMIFLGFLVAYPLRRGFNRRWVLLAVLPAVAAAILLSLSEFVLEQIGQLPGSYYAKSDDVRQFLTDVAHLKLGALRATLRDSIVLLMYLGQWSLPFTLILIPAILAKLTPIRRRLAWFWIAGFTIGGTLALAAIGWLMPMTLNVLRDFGMGIRSLSGGLPRAPHFVWVAVTALAALGAALAVLIIAVRSRDLWFGQVADSAPNACWWHVVFLLVVAVLDFGPMACSYAPLFDRYLLLFLPLLMAILVALGIARRVVPNPWSTGAAAFLLVALLGFGVAATHDYLEWNRVRWASTADLQGRLGLAPQEIDGGFEYNNFHNARGRLRAGWVHRRGEYGLVDRSSLRARIAFSPLPDHEVLAQRECIQWLPWGVSRLYLLNKRLSPDAGATHSTN